MSMDADITYVIYTYINNTLVKHFDNNYSYIDALAIMSNYVLKIKNRFKRDLKHNISVYKDRLYMDCFQYRFCDNEELLITVKFDIVEQKPTASSFAEVIEQIKSSLYNIYKED